MKITIIGVGAMGGAFAEGLLKSKACAPGDLTLANPHTGKLQRFADKGVKITSDNVEAVKDADIIALVVKPWVVEDVIREIKDAVWSHRQTILNMAASVKGEQLSRLFGATNPGPAIFQVIPNIAIAQCASMTFISTVKASEEQIRAVEGLFNRLGRAMVVPEKLLGAGTSLSGCGIAYAMRYVRAASEGGVELGFKADDAKEIVLQTMKGAVELLQANGNHPEAEIDKVTTPGGLTIRGLNAMEREGFTNAVISGIKAGM